MDKEYVELNYKVENLSEKTSKMEKKQEYTDSILNEIRSGISGIKEVIVASKEQEELKNQLLLKDIDGMKERIKKLENNQRWLVTSIIAEVLGIVFGIIMLIIQKGI